MRPTILMWSKRLQSMKQRVPRFHLKWPTISSETKEVITIITFIAILFSTAGGAVYYMIWSAERPNQYATIADLEEWSKKSPCIRASIPATVQHYNEPLKIRDLQSIKKGCEAQDILVQQKEFK